MLHMWYADTILLWSGGMVLQDLSPFPFLGHPSESDYSRLVQVKDVLSAAVELIHFWF